MIQREEDKLHKFVWRYLVMTMPDDAVYWSNENRQNGAREGARRKERGCIPGVPDISVTYQGRSLHIELKTAKGRVKPEQRALHARLKAAGAAVGVCRSLEDVTGFLVSQGVPLRGRIVA